jgi:hypothetical protein
VVRYNRKAGREQEKVPELLVKLKPNSGNIVENSGQKAGAEE